MKITWFPKDLLDLSGELGLTHIPGDCTSLNRSLDALVEVGTTHLVCLVEEDELRRMEPPETILQRTRSVEARGIEFFHQPIVDFEAPQLTQAQRTTTYILQALSEGGKVVMHCWAGLGRAGTMASCLLVLVHDWPAEEAIQQVRWIRPGAVQSESQELLIKSFEVHHANRLNHLRCIMPID